VVGLFETQARPDVGRSSGRIGSNVVNAALLRVELDTTG